MTTLYNDSWHPFMNGHVCLCRCHVCIEMKCYLITHKKITLFFFFFFLNIKILKVFTFESQEDIWMLNGRFTWPPPPQNRSRLADIPRFSQNEDVMKNVRQADMKDAQDVRPVWFVRLLLFNFTLSESYALGSPPRWRPLSAVPEWSSEQKQPAR